MKKIKTKVKITATVEHIITHDSDEDVTERVVDIYLHGRGEDGHIDKEDLGGDYVIEII